MKTILYVLLILVGYTSYAQTSPPVMATPPTDEVPIENPLQAQKTDTYFGIGLQAGLATGSGMMFRAMIPERYAVEATIGIVTLGDYTYFSSGVEAQYRLNANNNERIFLLLGGGFYSKNKGEGNIFDAPFRAGFGAGYEWFFGNGNAMLGAEVPLTLFFEENELVIFPTPQISFMYYFR